jgi:UDP-N-acetyl-2-amino-2-deoxyglucuronate dehydrogenase
MAKTYTAAIVGCGSIGHAHAEGYQIAGVELVAIADPQPVARQQYVHEYGALQEFATVEEMLQKAQPDLVSVCTWHLLHPAPTIAAATARVEGVICEKPMAIGMAAANSMVEVCDTSGTKLVISHQRRFTRGWERARELVQEGAIGKSIMVDNKVGHGLMNWGTHTIDGARFVLGDPKPTWVMGAVERRTDRFERDTPIEDSCMGLVQFDDGSQMTIQSDLNMEDADAGSFRIRGSEGMISVSEARVSLFNGETSGWHEIDLGDEEIAGIGGNTNAAQVRELIAWIEGGPEHRGSGHQARVTVEIMMALYESARQHQVIHLPMQEKAYPLELMIAEGTLPLAEQGRYDIRGFLSWEGVDPERFSELREQGLGHHAIMRQLHEEMESE